MHIGGYNRQIVILVVLYLIYTSPESGSRQDMQIEVNKTKSETANSTFALFEEEVQEIDTCKRDYFFSPYLLLSLLLHFLPLSWGIKESYFLRKLT